MLNLMSAQDLGCFCPGFAEARQHFIDTYQQLAPGLIRSCHSYSHPLTGPRGEPLSCEVLHLGQTERPQQLLVLISGTHGVEGFTGSAIQTDCLPLLAEVLQQQQSLGIIMIHAFNPWGFAWLRRYDHEGIDLNRNFIDFSATLPDNPGYEQLHSHLLSIGDVTADNLHLLWQGMTQEEFVKVITEGQYKHEDGFFFGGKAPSWSRKVLEEVTADSLFSSADRIAVVDLHTGLGPYGYGEIINDHPSGSTGYDWVINWYKDNAQSTELGESVSSPKQGLVDFHWHKVIGKRGCFVTLEFGTYSISHLLLSTIQEQQYQNQLSQSSDIRDLENTRVQQLKQFFYPQETSWQQQVLFRGRQVVSMALDGIMS
jgi:hypothetical protein